MKSKLLLFAMIFFCVLHSYAEKVNIEKAEKVARSYVRTVPQIKSRSNIQLSRTVFKELKPSNSLRASQEEAMYYVFSMDNNDGFIIVSADDIAVPVLGYSEDGNYDESNPNLSYWLDCLAQEIASGIENNIPQSAEIKAKWETYLNDNAPTLRASTAVVVNPLIQTKWNQGDPYNALCPGGSVTGCVATAMAQVMKYWNYPETGTGSHSYPHPTYGLQSANFGNTTYDWINMTNTYSSSSMQAQKDAVAALMYHCGVSVDMNYSPAESGASSSAVAPALVNYFKYDAGISLLWRDYYSYVDWINILKKELNESRPVFYSGQGSAGGHAFVCDGYDSDDLFHFNWGWGGMSDGYFEMSALNPGSLGIGGGAGGFNSGQGMIVGIRPNVGGSTSGVIRLGLSNIYPSLLSLTNVSTSFNVTMVNLTNISSIAFPSSTVLLGLQLCKEDGTSVKYSYVAYLGGASPGAYWSSLSLSYSLPSTLTSGIYKLYGAFSTATDPNTPIKIEGPNGGDKYISIVVADNGTVTLTTASDIVPALSLVSLSTVGTLYQGKTGKFIATVTNSGDGDYNSKLRMELNGTEIETQPVVIPAGATKEIGFSGTINLPAGTTFPVTLPLTLWYDPNNNQSTPSAQLGASQDLVVQDTPSPAALSVTSFLFPDANAVSANNPNLSVTIKNTGGIFDGPIIVYISTRIPNDAGYYPFISTFGTESVTIEQGEVKTILFNDPLNLPAGEYYGWVFATNDGINYYQVNYNYSFILAAPVYPTSTWSPQSSFPTKWNDPTNWSPVGIPSATNNVVIPKSASYPILTAPATVNEIHFAPGAELGRQDLLTYDKAFVQLDFSDPTSRGRWWMLTNPLQQLFLGDLSFGGLPNVYINKYIPNSTTGKGTWTAQSGYNQELGAGEDFQIWLDNADLVNPDKSKGLSNSYANGIITLPHFEDPKAADVYLTGFSPTRDPNKEYKLANGNFTRDLKFGLGVNGILYFAATGNPFMSSISFDKLLADNSSLIGGTYWVWVGAGANNATSPGKYVTYNNTLQYSLGSTDVSLDGIFSPMQSFIVERNAGVTNTQIAFNIANISATGGSAGLRSSTQSKDLLEIIASTPQSSVRTVIASREAGSLMFNSKDSRRFSGGINLLPDLYMLKPDANNSMTAVVANVLDEIKEETVIPLAISTTYEGQITLSFTGMDTYNAHIFLVDNNNKKENELTGQPRYEYTFNYVPEKVNGTVTANENRFFIRLSPANMTGIGSATPNNILIYSSGANTIQVASGELIQQVSVFNLQGQKVYDNASINAYEHTVTGIIPGIYVVKAISKNDLKTTKIIVK